MDVETEATEWVRAGTTEDVPVDGALVFRAKGREIAIFCQAGVFHAVDHLCLHRGGPLSEGYLKDGILTCPWHWWRYEIASGRCLADPWRRLQTYRVAIERGEIFVEVLPAPRAVPIVERMPGSKEEQ